MPLTEELANPLNETAVVPFRFAPTIVTFVPGLPKKGEKLEIDGCTTKLLVVVIWPPGATTFRKPVPAFAGTVVVICVLESTVNDAGNPVTPPNFTSEALRK